MFKIDVECVTPDVCNFFTDSSQESTINIMFAVYITTDKNGLLNKIQITVSTKLETFAFNYKFNFRPSITCGGFIHLYRQDL